MVSWRLRQGVPDPSPISRSLFGTQDLDDDQMTISVGFSFMEHPVISSNVGKRIINHPPVITMFVGGIKPFPMGVL